MRIDAQIAALRREGELLALALADADLDKTVPTCPEWTVRELSHHVGRVHRWAAAHVRDRVTEPMSTQDGERAWGSMPADDDLLAWFRDGHQTLIHTLVAAPVDLICWTFLPATSPLAFWVRRQAHETAIHRVDVEFAVRGDAAGRSEVRFDVDFAVDGIDELLLCFFASRPRNRARSEVPRTLAVSATDADAGWLIRMGPDGAHPQRYHVAPGRADCVVRAPARELYVGLWNRGPLDAFEVSGDTSVLETWRSGAAVRWS